MRRFKKKYYIICDDKNIYWPKKETYGFKVNFICFKTSIQVFINHPSMICDINARELFNVYRRHLQNV